MAIEIRVPALGESVTEATVGEWFKKTGDQVSEDEPLCELETDKVTVEVPAPASGVLGDITVQQGETVEVGALLAALNDGAADGTATSSNGAEQAQAPSAAPPPQTAPQETVQQVATQAASSASGTQAAAPASAPQQQAVGQADEPAMPPSPAARRALAEGGLQAADVAGSGRRGQVLKEDVMAAQADGGQSQQAVAPPAANTGANGAAPQPYVPAQMPVPAQHMRVPSSQPDEQREERVKMSRLRQTIARRLKDAQNTAAMLTTFNDVDMTAVMDMRRQYKELFEKRHGVKLGFMGFFVKACLQALKEIPAVNAELDGDEIVYKNYYHIGVAVGTDKGLVVPVVRDADQMNIAEIEGNIAAFGKRARDGRLGIQDMQGGTFTISNGGVYGSLLSTPILNAPQSGILGMHRIEERAVVRDGEIVARPMMNLALSYDHRIVDGKEAVTFLVRIKECLEDPHRFILEL